MCFRRLVRFLRYLHEHLLLICSTLPLEFDWSIPTGPIVRQCQVKSMLERRLPVPFLANIHQVRVRVEQACINIGQAVDGVVDSFGTETSKKWQGNWVNGVTDEIVRY